MWLIYALLSAFFASFRKINDKHLSHSVHHLHLAWMRNIATLPVLGVLALAMHQLLPRQTLGTPFWVGLIMATLVTTPLDTLVYFQSLKHGELSKTVPLLALWPVVMLLSGALFLQQIPTVPAIVAVLTIMAGVYVLNTKRGSGNMLRNIWRDRGTRFGLIGVATVSANSTLGTLAATHSSPLFYAFWSNLASSIVFFAMAQIIAPGKFRGVPVRRIAQGGIIQGLSSTMYFYAITAGSVAYVTAARSATTTLAAFLGARHFNEGLERRKVVAICLIALGAIILGITAQGRLY